MASILSIEGHKGSVRSVTQVFFTLVLLLSMWNEACFHTTHRIDGHGVNDGLLESKPSVERLLLSEQRTVGGRSILGQTSSSTSISLKWSCERSGHARRLKGLDSVAGGFVSACVTRVMRWLDQGHGEARSPCPVPFSVKPSVCHCG